LGTQPGAAALHQGDAMMKHLAVVLLIGGLAVGCAGPNPYRRVDLSADLPPEAVRRYEQEWHELPAAERTAHMARLEHSNWWLPGLVAYYRRGSVDRMEGPAGPVYHVSYGQGLGPLSALYSRGEHATYGAGGERLSGGAMGAVLLGHLAMTHHSDAIVPGGQHQKMDSWHLLHHVLNIHVMDGHRYVSLFTLPNAVGADLPAGRPPH
jgi:hypothetical protein